MRRSARASRFRTVAVLDGQASWRALDSIGSAQWRYLRSSGGRCSTAQPGVQRSIVSASRSAGGHQGRSVRSRYARSNHPIS
ncbi:Uncharacterised protein [Mycobacteroides abscessus subsp. abscessus]|nr:Uncharacterised protein [Mycobacteroides abscessus subsp. abscessus]